MTIAAGCIMPTERLLIFVLYDCKKKTRSKVCHLWGKWVRNGLQNYLALFMLMGGFSISKSFAILQNI
jgi:hypothetical protein